METTLAEIALSIFLAKARVVTKKAATPAAPRSLRHLQIVLAKPQGSEDSFHLMVDSMTPTSLLFKTNGRLKEQMQVELETLLDGYGTFRVVGRIDWLLLSPTGLRGEAKLEVSARERAIIDSFLARQEERIR